MNKYTFNDFHFENTQKTCTVYIRIHFLKRKYAKTQRNEKKVSNPLGDNAVAVTIGSHENHCCIRQKGE